MIAFLFSMTALDALYLPLAVAAAFVAFAPTREKPAPAGIAVLCGALMGLLLVRTLPVWPPVGGIGFYPYMLITGLLVGLFADRPRYRFIATILYSTALPCLIIVLVAGEEQGGNLRGTPYLLFPVLILAGIFLFSRQIRTGQRFAAGRALFFASAGLTAIAFLYGSRLGLHSLSLAAALFGTLFAITRFGPRWTFSASFTAGAGWLTLATTLIFTRDLLAFPVALTGLCLLVPHAAQSISGNNQRLCLGLELAMGLAIAIAAPAAFLMRS